MMNREGPWHCNQCAAIGKLTLIWAHETFGRCRLKSYDCQNPVGGIALFSTGNQAAASDPTTPSATGLTRRRRGRTTPYQASRVEAQVKPEPKAVRSTRSFSLSFPCLIASHMQIGIVAAVVFPVHSMVFTIFSSGMLR